jgi:hypothetical protein
MGLKMGEPSTTKETARGGLLLGRTEDLNRELQEINQSVGQRVRSKQQMQNEKEEKARQEEQMRRLKIK